ncbi:MAG: ExbD/TolR family protein [Rariglobus sp.]
MKYSCVILFLALFIPVRAEGPSMVVVDGGKAKILKVYTATLDSVEYRAYAINWKGQEVVATVPTSVIKTKHKVGDELAFVVFRVSTSVSGPILVIAEDMPMPIPGTALAPNPVKSDLKELNIRIDEKNIIWMEGKQYELSALSAELLKKAPAKHQVVLHSHPDSSYTTTVKILDVLKEAKITNVMFTADSEE